MPIAFADESMGWAELGTEGTHLALERAAPDDPESAEHVGRFLGVSLQVASGPRATPSCVHAESSSSRRPRSSRGAASSRISAIPRGTC